VIILTTLPDKIFLGTSGWSYKDWIGPFYTKKDKSMLRAYSKIFKTVEIDSTFYRYPSKGTVMGWTKYSPDDFVYSAKLPKLITHEKKLDLNQGVEEDLEKFIELIEPLSLSGKLGCVLIQLPPRFEYEPKELENFFKILPTHIRFAVEFRDPSWMRKETWALLEKYQVAYTIVDEPLLPPEIHITTNIAYFRWHGHGTRPWYNYRYHNEELQPWIPKIRKTAENVQGIYGYFNNHYHGYAVENCLQVLEMLGLLTAEQTETKNKVENYFRRSAKLKESTLEAFVEPKEMNFESLLRSFIDDKRLKRAQRIKDNELKMVGITEERIEALIRDYHIVIDLETNTILHDCADWSRVLPTKKLCKHIGKLLLSIDREKAIEILRKLYVQRETWQFKPYTQ
jgi:uncharacterized protein YecE (DUF72 family)